MSNKVSSESFWWKLVNNKCIFFIIAVLLVISPIILYFLKKYLCVIPVGWFETLINFGFLPSLLSALIVAWGAYIWRAEIRRFFLPQLTYIRAPIMVGIAPLIVARSKEIGIWEKYGLNMDLDFRYAGIDALIDLFKPEVHCPIIVASDVAIASFLGHENNRTKKIKVIPFVKIKDHLKIIVRKRNTQNPQPEYNTLAELKGREIGYYPDSVHDDFLSEFDLFNKDSLKKIDSVFECYRKLAVEKTVEACILWEPHYAAFNKFSDLHIINTEDTREYNWFLCLAATENYIKHNDQIVHRILRALKGATAYCRDKSNEEIVIRECIAYLHTEFTGLIPDELKQLLKKRQHDFSVDENLNDFKKKLMQLIHKGGNTGEGAAILLVSLWPGLIFENK